MVDGNRSIGMYMRNNLVDLRLGDRVQKILCGGGSMMWEREVGGEGRLRVIKTTNTLEIMYQPFYNRRWGNSITTIYTFQPETKQINVKCINNTYASRNHSLNATWKYRIIEAESENLNDILITEDIINELTTRFKEIKTFDEAIDLVKELEIIMGGDILRYLEENENISIKGGEC